MSVGPPALIILCKMQISVQSVCIRTPSKSVVVVYVVYKVIHPDLRKVFNSIIILLREEVLITEYFGPKRLL